MNVRSLLTSAALVITATAAITFCLTTTVVAGTSDPNRDGWEFLLDNKPADAKAAFQRNVDNADPKVAGEAYRGLSATARFLGDDEEECRDFFKSYQKDHDERYLSSITMKIVPFSRTPWGYKVKEGYSVLKKFSKEQGLFAGELQEAMAERDLNDGKFREAAAIIQRMGCIRDWEYIGPFDNISHSGYNKEYPPEKEVDFNKTYTGKDDNLVKWRQI